MEFLLILSFLLFLNSAESNTLFDYKFDTVLDGYAVSIHWNLDYVKKVVDFAVEIQTSRRFQWFAFGFSDIGKFPGSDVCVMTRGKSTVEAS